MDLSSVHMLTLPALQRGGPGVTSSRTGEPHLHSFAFRFLATRVGFRPAGTRFLVRGAAGGVAFRSRI